MPMGSVPGGIAGAAGFGIGAGARAATRFFLGAALALTAVFFLAATFLPPVFLRTATLPVEVFFFLVVVLAFFLVAMGSTSTLRTENVRENDASFVNGMPDAQRYHAPSAPKKPILRTYLKIGRVRPAHRSTEPERSYWCVGRTLREPKQWYFEIGSSQVCAERISAGDRIVSQPPFPPEGWKS